MCYTSAFFFFNDTATTEIYTLSLHDALPIFAEQMLEESNNVIAENLARQVALKNGQPASYSGAAAAVAAELRKLGVESGLDRKSTRLNSSHPSISYAVFCLKKKKNYRNITTD